MDIEENDDNLHFTLFQNNRRVSIDSYVMEKTDDGFMREIFGYTESEHEIIGSSRRRVLRMFNQPRHYCVEPSPEFGCPLPDYCITAWMSSGLILGRDASPSKMVIVFFLTTSQGCVRRVCSRLTYTTWIGMEKRGRQMRLNRTGNRMIG